MNESVALQILSDIPTPKLEKGIKEVKEGDRKDVI
jgi:hypothetical protein